MRWRWWPAPATTRLLAELGVVFLLFTLGLEFALPRMIAMRREVFGLGSAQVAATAAVFATLASPRRRHCLAGRGGGGRRGRDELDRDSPASADRALRAEPHPRPARLQHAAFPGSGLRALPGARLGARRRARSASSSTACEAVVGGVLAIGAVLAAGRWLLRPLFQEMAHSRLRELFTLAVLLVVLASAWVSSLAGLSLALGAFLAGMMLAETEYRHQIESVIRPFRDILLGLFFISVGMLLDVRAARRGARARSATAGRPRRAEGGRRGARDPPFHRLRVSRRCARASSSRSAASSAWRSCTIALASGPHSGQLRRSRCWWRSCCPWS